MKLLCVTDLHSDRKALHRIMETEPEADIVLLGGDITNFGTPGEAEDIVEQMQRRYGTVLAVAGNCDSAAIDDRLAKLQVALFQRGVVHDDVGFYGVSAMPPWIGGMYSLTELQIAAALEKGRQQVGRPSIEVVLSHFPPHDTRLDETRSGEHVGSTALREFIQSCRPTLVVCGHIHEGRGLDQLGDTQLVNCGPAYQGNYAVVNVNASVAVELKQTRSS